MPTAGKTIEGQLRPLEDRMSRKNYQRRAAKVEARKQFRTQAALDYAKLMGVAQFQRSILTRGLFGRLRWALLKK